jgi:hypothetical protein
MASAPVKILQVLTDPGDKIPCPSKTKKRGRCNLFSIARTRATVQKRYDSAGGPRVVWGRTYRCGASHEFLLTWVVDPADTAPV